MDSWGKEKKSMINKSFPEIVLDDIERLIENGIAESKTIEYKRELPNNSDEAKKEFLADVSSFANSEGGDILFGIEAENGNPTKLSNLHIADNDKARLQYESIIRDGIAPRIKFDIKIIDINNTKVLLIRIYKSWNKPHRVEYKNTHKFYSRHSAGKYLLDIEDLRNAFLSSNQITEKIRAFINIRNQAILDNEGIQPLEGKGKIAFYIIPIDSLISDRRINVFNLKTDLFPPYCNRWNSRINLEGYVNYSKGNGGYCYSYVQIYRSGIIEAVFSLSERQDGKQLIPSKTYEKEIINSTKKYLEILKSLEIFPPIVFGLSFINIRGYNLGVDINSEDIRYTKDILHLPETIINEYSDEIDRLLRDTFDSVWNAFGFEKSFNYDENGRWIE
ncbi:MAG: hypothetical protein DCF19_02220 [Pseudanabaena frigida]|uniref:Schlafen AlbA-2 domain-containing protein n=1 Tax=Pseudanabaena frigida TaxID=945775 RepID=A0A2W4WHI6_9CYAN|nr:MAG: hypothetical protein DCF19_02220 [Pseudanabaena frigida]